MTKILVVCFKKFQNNHILGSGSEHFEKSDPVKRLKTYCIFSCKLLHIKKLNHLNAIILQWFGSALRELSRSRSAWRIQTWIQEETISLIESWTDQLTANKLKSGFFEILSGNVHFPPLDFSGLGNSCRYSSDFGSASLAVWQCFEYEFNPDSKQWFLALYF